MKALLKKPKFISIFTQGAVSGLSMVSFSFLARIFIADELAYWTLFLSISTLYNMINHGFIAEVFIRKWGQIQSPTERIKLMGSTWQIMIYVSFFCLLFIGIYFIFLYSEKNIFRLSKIPFPLLLITFIIVDAPSSVSYWKFQSELNFQRILSFKFLEQMLFLIAVCLLFYSYDLETDQGKGGFLTEVIMLYLGIKMMISLLLVYFRHSGVQFVLRGTKKDRKEIVGFGKYAVGTQAVSSLASDADFYLILNLKGAAASADYAIAKKCLPVIGIPVNAIAKVSYPKLVKAYSQGMSKYDKMMHQELGFLCVLVWPVCLFVILGAEWIIGLIGGAQFAESADILRAMVFFTFLMPVDKIIGQTLNVFNLPSWNFAKMLVSISVNVVGDLVVLMLSDNLVYVAYVSVLSALSGVVVGYLALRRQQKINLLKALRFGVMRFMGGWQSET